MIKKTQSSFRMVALISLSPLKKSNFNELLFTSMLIILHLTAKLFVLSFNRYSLFMKIVVCLAHLAIL